jgi:thioredoxin 1
MKPPFWSIFGQNGAVLARALEAIANDREDVVIAKVNIDESQDLAVKFAIRSIPSLLIFKDGKVVGQKVGACSKSQIEEFITSSI